MADILGTNGGDSVTVSVANGSSSPTDIVVSIEGGGVGTSGEQVNNINLYDGNDSISIDGLSLEVLATDGYINLGAGNDDLVIGDNNKIGGYITSSGDRNSISIGDNVTLDTNIFEGDSSVATNISFGAADGQGGYTSNTLHIGQDVRIDGGIAVGSYGYSLDGNYISVGSESKIYGSISAQPYKTTISLADSVTIAGEIDFNVLDGFSASELVIGNHSSVGDSIQFTGQQNTVSIGSDVSISGDVNFAVPYSSGGNNGVTESSLAGLELSVGDRVSVNGDFSLSSFHSDYDSTVAVGDKVSIGDNFLLTKSFYGNGGADTVYIGENASINEVFAVGRLFNPSGADVNVKIGAGSTIGSNFTDTSYGSGPGAVLVTLEDDVYIGGQFEGNDGLDIEAFTSLGDRVTVTGGINLNGGHDTIIIGDDVSLGSLYTEAKVNVGTSVGPGGVEITITDSIKIGDNVTIDSNEVWGDASLYHYLSPSYYKAYIDALDFGGRSIHIGVNALIEGGVDFDSIGDNGFEFTIGDGSSIAGNLESDVIYNTVESGNYGGTTLGGEGAVVSLGDNMVVGGYVSFLSGHTAMKLNIGENSRIGENNDSVNNPYGNRHAIEFEGEGAELTIGSGTTIHGFVSSNGERVDYPPAPGNPSAGLTNGRDSGMKISVGSDVSIDGAVYLSELGYSIRSGLGLDNAIIGDNAVFGDNLRVNGAFDAGYGSDTVKIGENARIQEFVKSDAGDHLPGNVGSSIEIGDGGLIGQYAHFDRGDDTLKLGDNNTVLGEISLYAGADVIQFGNASGGFSLAGSFDAGGDDDRLDIVGSNNYFDQSVSGGGGFDTLGLAKGTTVLDADGDSVVVGNGVDYSAINSGEEWTLTLLGGDVATVNYWEFIEEAPDNVVCFTEKTRILTDKGEVAAINLSVGDLVETYDNGLQPVRWVGIRSYSAADIQKNPTLAPVLIKAGALGQGLPKNDLMVSQQHRVLINSRMARRMFNQADVLVAAKQLIALEGISILYDASDVTYVHFMCDNHELVWSDGTLAETLLLGDQALASLPDAAKDEIHLIFGGSINMSNVRQPVRPLIKGSHMRKAAFRMNKNGRLPVEMTF